jgi:hypothetical protein
MKIFLVVMFLMQDGSWLPGDIVAPDGWSSLSFETMEECLVAEKNINKNLNKSYMAGMVYGVCLDMKPGLLDSI